MNQNIINNLEICDRIAWIEGIETPYKTYDDSGYYREIEFCYDPLNDDALCFQLIIKHKVEFEHGPDGTYRGWHTKSSSDERGEFTILCDTLNEAICLAVIALHDEEL